MNQKIDLEKNKIKAIGLWPFICLLVLVVGLFIVASFYDLDIAKYLFSKDEPLGIFISSIGLAPGFFGGIIASGVIIAFNLKNKKKDRINILKKLILYGYSIAMALGLWYYIAHQISSHNGYNINEFIGLAIILPFACGALYLGYRIGKKTNDDNLLLISLLYGIVLIITALGLAQIFKHIKNRPRYRVLVDESTGLTMADYCNWWEPFKYHEGINILKTDDNLQSFPSGHTTGAASTIMLALYLPLLFPKLGRERRLLFLGGVLWMFLVAFCRMWLGAHFLSDTMFAAIYTVGVIFAWNIIIEKKLINKELFELI